MMLRPASSRALLRSTPYARTARSTTSSSTSTPFAPTRARARASTQGAGQHRSISTQPAHLKSRSWKNSALRWGLAVAGIYYYNTSPVFAEHPQNNLLNPNVDAFEDTEDSQTSSTLDTLTASSRRRKSEKDASILQSAVERTSEKDASTSAENTTAVDSVQAADMVQSDPGALEDEAAGEGAFNPETGEINWDCPCLGGMAYGPCGTQFREAFSCFVFSTEEPKGMDCIDKFQGMQNCFREHPEVYKAELEDDEELDAELAAEREELKNQIAERKARDAQIGSDSSSRLLEEADLSSPSAPVSEMGKSTPNKKQQAGASEPSKPQSQNKSRPSSKTPTKSDKARGSSDEREHINDGQKSSVQSEPTVNPVELASVVEEGDVIPKAAHDARDGKSNGKRNAK